MATHAPARRLAALALASCALGCATSGGAGRGASAGGRQQVVTLPSGLRLAIIERPGALRFLVATSTGCGAAADPPGRAGLAHLVEHLTFRARGPGGVARAEALAASSAAFTARTTPDATATWTTGLPDGLDAALAVEAARLADPLAGVDPADLDRERAVVLRELARREAFLGGAAGLEALAAHAFPGHPYGRPPGGDAAGLAAATLDEARALAASCWRPEASLLLVVGPWPHEALLPRVLAALGPLADGLAAAAPRPSPPVPPPPAPAAALEVLRAPVRHPALLLGWTVPVGGLDLERAQ
ncbi:MAG TPA: insulinase family protein, partial [Anaeromyxobacteraceae bacterium]|nr:insulinase family protein [Anaeromyxobacteraceae bacterium]